MSLPSIITFHTCSQYLARTLHPESPSHDFVFFPSGFRTVNHTHQSRFLYRIAPLLSDNTVSTIVIINHELGKRMFLLTRKQSKWQIYVYSHCTYVFISISAPETWASCILLIDACARNPFEESDNWVEVTNSRNHLVKFIVEASSLKRFFFAWNG